MKDLMFRDETYAIIGACQQVYAIMGCGFLEQVYQECLEIELRQRDIPSLPHKPLLLKYKNLPLKQTYTPDLICYEKIIVELKATADLSPEHMSQVINYLKSTSLRLGLLVNFGHHPGLQCQRVVL